MDRSRAARMFGEAEPADDGEGRSNLADYEESGIPMDLDDAEADA